MNLPNRLTLLRVILVPVFLLFYFCSAIPGHYLLSLLIFIAASITDALDGHLARKHNLITNFGKFLDPLADKILVMAALACFVATHQISAIPFIIIMAREFMVSGLRLVVANHGTVVPAGFWGKLKTAFTMVTIIAILVYLSFAHDFSSFHLSFADKIDDVASIVMTVLIWISTVITVISGLTYLHAYRKYINPAE